MMMAKKPPLKNCPFCGGVARYRKTFLNSRDGGVNDAVFVSCTVCDARTGRVLHDAKKHTNGEEYVEAGEAWNKRVL